jgi:hypothetical protein
VIPFEQIVGAIMTDSPAAGAILWSGQKLPLSPLPLPILYFDDAQSLSHLNGIIGVTLTVTGNLPDGEGGVFNCASVAAHLKCNIPAAMALRAALDNALLLAQPVEKPEGKAN